jgi:hypothetical protein
VYESLLGCTFNIKTLNDNNINICIDNIIKPETIKKIPSEGMSIESSMFDKGDLFIQFNVIYPEDVSYEQKVLLKKINKKKLNITEMLCIQKSSISNNTIPKDNINLEDYNNITSISEQIQKTINDNIPYKYQHILFEKILTDLIEPMKNSYGNDDGDADDSNDSENMQSSGLDGSYVRNYNLTYESNYSINDIKKQYCEEPHMNNEGGNATRCANQ